MPKLSRLLFLIATIRLVLIAGALTAFNLDEEFTQRIDESFCRSLIENSGKERAVFFVHQDGQKPLLLYLRHRQGDFILRGNLSPTSAAKLDFSQFNPEVVTFSPEKINKKPLYSRGSAVKFSFSAGIALIDTLFIPHQFENAANSAFISDLGYLEARFRTGRNLLSPTCLDEFAAKISRGRIRLASRVKLNRYYLLKDNFWGPVDYLTGNSIESIMAKGFFDPVHKMTMFKGVSEWQKKHSRDLRLFFAIIADEEYIFSQDLRLKLGLVPATVSLNPQRIEQTDIGSGQNQMVFLSIGPGINYFDDPWKQKRRNIPGPRLLMSRLLYGNERLQIYPSFSIDPIEEGEKRLAAINRFQLKAAGKSGKNKRLPLWLEAEARNDLIENLEDAVCRYGLINDSDRLYLGFNFSGENFRGNVVNNEVRLSDGISLRAFVNAVIIPPGTGNDYRDSYAHHFSGISPHWQYNCATHFNHLFIEAPTPDDKGFRIAWLMFQLNRSHPTLGRMMLRAQRQNRISALKKMSESLNRIIADTGFAFFNTAAALQRRKNEAELLRRWCVYLCAYRMASANAAKQLQNFIEFYKLKFNKND